MVDSVNLRTTNNQNPNGNLTTLSRSTMDYTTVNQVIGQMKEKGLPMNMAYE